MVRCLGVLLVMMMLLCGCNQQSAPPTEPLETVSTPETTAPAGIYIPGSDMEQSTAGAVRSYRVEDSCYGCFAMGEDLLLLHIQEGEGKLSLYENADLQLVKTVSLGENVIPTLSRMQITQRGIGYFDGEDIVFLNTDLVEIGRMHLSEDLSGDAWLTRDWKSVYYCTEKGIWVLDLQTGISRLVKEQNAFRQEVTGCFGNGEVLLYELEVTQGQKQILLIDTSSGMVLQENEELTNLKTQADAYFYPTTVRDIRQLRFGQGENHKVLWPAETEQTPHILFDSNAVVMVGYGENQTALAYYDLETGKRTAQVTLNGITEVVSLWGDGKTGVWFLSRNDAGEQNLSFWDTGKTPTGDETVYTAPYYTRESPDEEGIALLAQKAAALGERFGVEILLWKDAAKTAPADYVFTEEHMTQMMGASLTKLEQLLSNFPEGFFTKSAEKLKIALVRDIVGVPDWGGLEENTNLQFWNGTVPVVALETGDTLERGFYHGVYHYMETRILSKSSALYEWNTLNPKGFAYDNSYITNLERTDTTYIEGENKYFIDLFSMSFPKEDRARIFEYACTAGNEDSFQTKVMREKLNRICRGIRTAFDLKKVEGTFLWEQYLQ